MIDVQQLTSLISTFRVETKKEEPQPHDRRHHPAGAPQLVSQFWASFRL